MRSPIGTLEIWTTKKIIPRNPQWLISTSVNFLASSNRFTYLQKVRAKIGTENLEIRVTSQLNERCEIGLNAYFLAIFGYWEKNLSKNKVNNFMISKIKSGFYLFAKKKLILLFLVWKTRLVPTATIRKARISTPAVWKTKSKSRRWFVR